MRCLLCYKELGVNEDQFHVSCMKKIFASDTLPVISFNEGEIEQMALKTIQSQTTVTGVQAKISVHLDPGKKSGQTKRMTIVGMWGNYILKPASDNYPQLPEVEDLTMHLAEAAKIKVVPHTLIRFNTGKLAYLTKRIDRIKNTKIHMEDMCQLTEKQTENKYKASYEQIGKAILKYSANPGLDIVNFAEIILFSFLTGNADMHLKNFSLIYDQQLGPVLSPAYDLLSTSLVNPLDDEDLALSLNGKKKKLKRKDFETAFQTMRLDQKQQENIFKKMWISRNKWLELIEASFMSEEFKTQYSELIDQRFKRLEY